MLPLGWVIGFTGFGFDSMIFKKFSNFNFILSNKKNTC